MSLFGKPKDRSLPPGTTYEDLDNRFDVESSLKQDERERREQADEIAEHLAALREFDALEKELDALENRAQAIFGTPLHKR